MIKELTEASENYPCQLIKWQKDRIKLEPFLENFKDEHDECVVVKSFEGYSIFTKGKYIGGGL